MLLHRPVPSCTSVTIVLSEADGAADTRRAAAVGRDPGRFCRASLAATTDSRPNPLIKPMGLPRSLRESAAYCICDIIDNNTATAKKRDPNLCLYVSWGAV
ncbi:hypothetical protein NDU88_000475 [Pleurodeles waltl]|uniref:Uncharacterized protein n=1 Tax=Pleurodeles waltl TaxID=8319 RepID=A0AAV7V568_PLEWA|nr:hypothetical protein NDU88_000475 [Pleurodeles waltl]